MIRVNERMTNAPPSYHKRAGTKSLKIAGIRAIFQYNRGKIVTVALRATPTAFGRPPLRRRDPARRLQVAAEGVRRNTPMNGPEADGSGAPAGDARRRGPED